jgi:protein TonB
MSKLLLSVFFLISMVTIAVASETVPTPLANMSTGQKRLNKLDTQYKNKFSDDVANGDTCVNFDCNDMFRSFLYHFKSAVNGVWRYPQEATLKGIEGVTPARITFNRRGEVVKIELLETSGAKILDEEVFRTLRAIGPVGSFPRGYDKDEFHLIAFFHYTGTQKKL